MQCCKNYKIDFPLFLLKVSQVKGHIKTLNIEHVCATGVVLNKEEGGHSTANKTKK
jgi:hypothetical protein